MDWADAMELVVARTRHERYRSLCADDHPRREEWRLRMIERATGAAPPAPGFPRTLTISGSGRPAPPLRSDAGGRDTPHPAVAESMALNGAMKRCPFRSRDAGCGCSGGRCALRQGAIVSHVDCFGCLAEYGPW